MNERILEYSKGGSEVQSRSTHGGGISSSFEILASHSKWAMKLEYTASSRLNEYTLLLWHHPQRTHFTLKDFILPAQVRFTGDEKVIRNLNLYIHLKILIQFERKKDAGFECM